MSGVSRRLTSKHTGPAGKRNVRHCPGQKPHRRSRSGCVTSAGLESVRHKGNQVLFNAPHAALWTARHGVRSHADAVALVIECSIPVV